MSRIFVLLTLDKRDVLPEKETPNSNLEILYKLFG